MKTELDMKTKVEGVAYSGIVMFLFAFSVVILIGLFLCMGGTILQLIF